MFKIKDRINTSKGTGEVVFYRRSTYSKDILFYCVKLDNSSEEYLCPIAEATNLNE